MIVQKSLCKLNQVIHLNELNSYNFHILFSYNKSDMIIYHYTDIKSAKAILKDQIIYETQSIVAEFGKGVFLTSLAPIESDQKLIENNYLTMSDKHKTKCAFAFHKNALANLKIKKINDIHKRNVWKTEGDICLKNYYFELIFRK